MVLCSRVVNVLSTSAPFVFSSRSEVTTSHRSSWADISSCSPGLSTQLIPPSAVTLATRRSTVRDKKLTAPLLASLPPSLPHQVNFSHLSFHHRPQTLYILPECHISTVVYSMVPLFPRLRHELERKREERERGREGRGRREEGEVEGSRE